jgi:hypothetical protein
VLWYSGMHMDWTALGKALAVGGALFYGVQKFFEVVGDKLNDDTKLEIAVWLLGVKVGQKVEPWPETFAKVFDRVFGTNHLSWKCFWRTSLAVYIAFGLWLLFTERDGFNMAQLPWMAVVVLITSLLPSYISLLETRYLLNLLKHVTAFSRIALIALDLYITTSIAILVSIYLYGFLYPIAMSPWPFDLWITYSLPSGLSAFPGNLGAALQPWRGLSYGGSTFLTFYPVFFTSIWLWLYAGSGFLLKFARRFDIGFEWFNRKFDIEKKPLQSIGLVAGALAALVYWTVVIVSRLVK